MLHLRVLSLRMLLCLGLQYHPRRTCRRGARSVLRRCSWSSPAIQNWEIVVVGNTTLYTPSKRKGEMFDYGISASVGLPLMAPCSLLGDCRLFSRPLESILHYSDSRSTSIVQIRLDPFITEALNIYKQMHHSAPFCMKSVRLSSPWNPFDHI